MVELVATLRRQCVEMDCGNCNTCVKRQAADAIEELSKRMDESIPKSDAEIIIEELSKPRWIPVSESLPENGKYVLCFCRANIVCVLRRDKSGDWYENPTHVYMSRFVTHWMPLPQPPEEG